MSVCNGVATAFSGTRTAGLRLYAFGRFGGTTTTYTGEGWCFSELDFEIEGVATPELCWETCLGNYGDDLVAIDWYEGYCYCQDDCTCMQDAPPGVVAITRDSAVDALPSKCGDRRKLESLKAHK